MKNKIIDLFCGCGGLSKGFEMAGFEVVAAIDMWNDAIKTFNHNHKKDVASCEDIHNWDESFLKNLNVDNNIVGIIGGPPCQGFSTVGTRDINDPRNHLYREYCRIVETIQPDFFVLENVRGLLTLSQGAFKDDIIRRFGQLGYNVNFKLLNAADYGVPQNRLRVFFVGTKNSNFEFPDGVEYRVTCEEALSDLPLLTNYDGDEDIHGYLSLPQNEYQALMRNNSQLVYNHQITKHSQQTIDIINRIPDGGSIKDLPREFWEIRKYNKAFERMGSNRQSNTVDTVHRNYFHYKENRIPTVRENARLQSFSDDFIFLGSKTSQYKQVGNAVPPLLAYNIAKSLKSHIKGDKVWI